MEDRKTVEEQWQAGISLGEHTPLQATALSAAFRQSWDDPPKPPSLLCGDEWEQRIRPKLARALGQTFVARSHSRSNDACRLLAQADLRQGWWKASCKPFSRLLPSPASVPQVGGMDMQNIGALMICRRWYCALAVVADSQYRDFRM
jgi:hypothetical protein